MQHRSGAPTEIRGVSRRVRGPRVHHAVRRTRGEELPGSVRRRAPRRHGGEGRECVPRGHSVQHAQAQVVAHLPYTHGPVVPRGHHACGARDCHRAHAASVRGADAAHLLAVGDAPHGEGAVLGARNHRRSVRGDLERGDGGVVRPEQEHHAPRLAAVGGEGGVQEIGRPHLRNEDRARLLLGDELELPPRAVHGLELAVLGLGVELKALNAASLGSSCAHGANDAPSLDCDRVAPVLGVQSRAV